jgi:glutaredoxin-like protein NrdH
MMQGSTNLLESHSAEIRLKRRILYTPHCLELHSGESCIMEWVAAAVSFKRAQRSPNLTGKGSPNMAKEPVKLFSLSTCSHCKSTKKLLNECTVKYEFVDVDLLEGDERRAILEDIKKFNPKCSFPTIIIGETVIVGYKEKEIKEALGL